MIGNIRMVFEKKSLYSLTDSDNFSNHWRSMSKGSWSNTICRFFQGILFHTEKKDGANTICIQSPQRNCYRYVLPNMKAIVHSPDRDTDFFNIARRSISIFVYTISRLHNLKVNRSIKKWFHIKKGKKLKLWQTQTTQMTKHFSQIHQAKQNPYCIA